MRHIIHTPVLDHSGPAWFGGTPEEQGYKHIPLPSHKRHDAKSNEYYVYSSETEYKSVLADSAVNAVTASEIVNPVKVVHAHSRLADVMDTKILEFVGMDDGSEPPVAPVETTIEATTIIAPPEAKAEESAPEVTTEASAAEPEKAE